MRRRRLSFRRVILWAKRNVGRGGVFLPMQSDCVEQGANLAQDWKDFTMRLTHYLLAAALIALPASTVFAQQTTTTPEQRHTIARRSANQQARIAHGEADGQITPKGAATAERHQNHINQQDARMRSRDNGHLTSADRHKLATEQDKTSKGIHNRNHNAVTDPGVTPK